MSFVFWPTIWISASLRGLCEVSRPLLLPQGLNEHNECSRLDVTGVPSHVDVSSFPVRYAVLVELPRSHLAGPSRKILSCYGTLPYLKGSLKL